MILYNIRGRHLQFFLGGVVWGGRSGQHKSLSSPLINKANFFSLKAVPDKEIIEHNFFLL